MAPVSWWFVLIAAGGAWSSPFGTGPSPLGVGARETGWGYPVNRTFEAPVGARYHAGVDVAAPCGTPVRAMADGEIVLATVHDPEGQGARRVVIRHDGEHAIFVEYAHLRRVVRRSGTVSRGEIVAFSGRSGDAECHLHVAARVGQRPARGYERERPVRLGYRDPATLFWRPAARTEARTQAGAEALTH